jgi:bifunctional non-homologous end joining protein LigD
MLATLIDAPFDDPAWVFETKFDGFRMLAEVQNGNVTLYSRNGRIVTDRYAPIAKALEGITHNTVLDGELVALDARDISRFQILQNALRANTRLRYYLFDILSLDGKDARGLALLRRKELLEGIIPNDPLLACSNHRPQYGTRYFKEAKRKGEEGIIAKRAASPYLSGRRSKDWLKVKVGYEQEVAIVGFTKPRRSRQHFGALVLAVRARNKWCYVGRVGTGFTEALLKSLHAKLSALRAGSSPFDRRVPDETHITWVRPRLVAEVKFTEWTAAGEMRHPVFLGLRDDKRPEEVIMEKAASLTR